MRRRNLLTGDASYVQSWSLEFVNAVTEHRYLSETARLRSVQLKLWNWALLLTLGFVALVEVVSTAGLAAMLASLSLCHVASFRDAFQSRLLWCIPNILFSYYLWTTSETWSHTDEIFRLFPSFLVNFYTVRHWTVSLLASLGECAVFTALSGTSILHSTGPLLLYLFLHCLLQKDLKDLWSLGDSYRRSEQHMKDIFNGSLEANFVTDVDGIVLHCNRAGRNLVSALGGAPLQYGKTSLLTLFQEDNSVKLEEMLKTSCAGEADEKELITKRLPSTHIEVSQMRGLGVMVRSQPMMWKRQQALLFSFEDVSLYVARRLFLTSIYRKLHMSVMDFSTELEKLHTTRQTLSARELFSFYQLHIEYGNSLLLQYYILGRVELRKEGFHLPTEVENVMEFASFRAFERSIDLQLSREEGFPASVFSDKLRHMQLLTNLLSFVIEHSREGSEVSMHCAVAGAQDGDVLLSYRVNFYTPDLLQADLEELFTSRKGEVKRRSLNDVITLIEKFGVGVLVFDTMLQVLKGFVTTANVGIEGKLGKATIMFSIPISCSASVVHATPVSLSTGKQRLNNLTVRWRAGSLHFVSSSSLPELSLQMPQKKMKRGMSEHIAINTHASPYQQAEIARFSPQPPPFAYRQQTASISSSSNSESSEELDMRTEEGKSRDSIIIRNMMITESSLRRDTDSLQSPSSLRPLRTHKLLVIDSNDYSRRIFKTLAAKSGFPECDEAKGEKDGLQIVRLMALQNSIYCVIFVSTAKASMNGVGVVQQIREVERTSHLPRTFICGVSDSQQLDPALFDSSIPRLGSEPDVQRVLKLASKR